MSASWVLIAGSILLAIGVSLFVFRRKSRGRTIAQSPGAMLAGRDINIVGSALGINVSNENKEKPESERPQKTDFATTLEAIAEEIHEFIDTSPPYSSRYMEAHTAQDFRARFGADLRSVRRRVGDKILPEERTYPRSRGEMDDLAKHLERVASMIRRRDAKNKKS